jgi:tetratricopeptide (TPR) repeat protein
MAPLEGWIMTKRSAVHRGFLAWLCVIGLGFGSGCAATGPGPSGNSLQKAQSHYNIGIDYISKDMVALGLRELLIAESFDPNNARIQYALGDGHLMRGKADDAEGYYLRAVEIAPKLHEARLNLAGLYCHTGRFEQCILHSKVIADDATYLTPWRALTNQGLAEMQLQRMSDARSSFETARDYRPDYWPMLLNLGILEKETGNHPKAVALFQQVLEQNPGLEIKAEANYRLAEIYIELGNRKRAVGYLMTAVADAPGGQWGVKSEEYLKLLR